jgi:hypothetical protein
LLNRRRNLKGVALQACQEIRHGLDDNAIGKMGLIHGRPMHAPVPEQGRWLAQVVRGYFAYHAVPPIPSGWLRFATM